MEYSIGLVKKQVSEYDQMMPQLQTTDQSIGIAPITQVTHVRNKNSNIQGRSLYVIKVIFHTIKNCS